MSDVVIRPSPFSVSVTVAHLLAVIATRDLKIFAVIDHGGEASSAGLELRETKVVTFGSPSAGTPVMEAAPLAALDLPLRVLVWAEDDATKVAYLDPGTYAERYGLTTELASRLASVTAVVEAAIAPTPDQPQEESE